MKYFRKIIVIVAFFIAFVFVFFFLLKMYFQEKIDVSITNKSGEPISLSIRTIDLDLNLTDEWQLNDIGDVLPGETKSTMVYLDGLTPEICAALIVKSNNKSIEFSCGTRVQQAWGFLTKATLVFGSTE